MIVIHLLNHLTACFKAHFLSHSNLSSGQSGIIELQASQTSLEKPGALNFGSKSDWIVSCQADFPDYFSFNQSIVHIKSRYACPLLVRRCDVVPASAVYSVNKGRSQPTTSASDKSHEQLSWANHPDLYPLSSGVIVNKWSRTLGVHPKRYCN